MCQRVVILVDPSDGSEFDALQDHLRILHVPSMLIRPLRTGHTPDLQFKDGVLRVKDQIVRPTVFWLRHTSLLNGTINGNSWLIMMRHVAELADHVLPGPSVDQPTQLADARRLGIAVPPHAIVVGNSAPIYEQSENKRVVKTLVEHVARMNGKTVRLSPAAVTSKLPRILDYPHMVQEWIRHQTEYRIYWINDEAISYGVVKDSPASLWSDPESVTVSTAQPPPHIDSITRRLAKHWGMRFTAIDLLVTAHGEPVFLEANPHGDWRWYERKAGSGAVTLSAALVIYQMHMEAVRN